MYSPVIDRSGADFDVIVFIALVERQHGAPRARAEAVLAPLRENGTRECPGNWGPGGAKLSRDRRGAHKLMYASFSRGGRKCGFSPYPPKRKRTRGDIIGFGPINEKTTFPSGWE